MTLIYAHRGLHRLARENTLEAFRAAVALGVDGVELDVRRCRDGALVVHHDPVAQGVVIAGARRSELPDYVPSFASAMAALEGVRVNVEIKNLSEPAETSYDPSGSFARQVVDYVHEIDGADRVMVSSFDEATCAHVRAHDPDLDVGWLLWGIDVSSALVRARALGLNAVHPHFMSVNDAVLDQAGELGLGVNVWTVNETADLERMVLWGVRSIISDDPALARTVLEDVRRRTGR